MFLDDDVGIELKAVKTLENGHFAQCPNYLKATGKKLGLVVSFGEEKVKIRHVRWLIKAILSAMKIHQGLWL